MQYTVCCLMTSQILEASPTKFPLVEYGEIVGTVDARSEIYFEARCNSNCSLNNSPSISLLSCISTCNWSFSWSKE